jgi:hypothetical protein
MRNGYRGYLTRLDTAPPYSACDLATPHGDTSANSSSLNLIRLFNEPHAKASAKVIDAVRSGVVVLPLVVARNLLVEQQEQANRAGL